MDLGAAAMSNWLVALLVVVYISVTSLFAVVGALLFRDRDALGGLPDENIMWAALFWPLTMFVVVPLAALTVVRARQEKRLADARRTEELERELFGPNPPEELR